MGQQELAPVRAPECVVVVSVWHQCQCRLQQDGSSARAIYHLEKAVYYNPNNEEANVALGYKKSPVWCLE